MLATKLRFAVGGLTDVLQAASTLRCISVQYGLFEDAAFVCCVTAQRTVGWSLTRLVIRGVGEAVCEGGRFAAAGVGSWVRSCCRLQDKLALGSVSGCSYGSARHNASASAERERDPHVHPQLTTAEYNVNVLSAPRDSVCSYPRFA